MHETPIQTFTSHIDGKNAKVEIFADRIEWKQPRGLSGGKLAAGALTMGMSLLATGVKDGKAGTEMIPVKAISSVTTKRDGMLNSKVCIVCSGNTIDFRVSHSEAAGIAHTLKQLVLGAHPAQQTAQEIVSAPPAPQTLPVLPPTPPTATPAAPQSDIMTQLQQLAQLKDAGVLTEEEFASKKAELLSRL